MEKVKRCKNRDKGKLRALVERCGNRQERLAFHSVMANLSGHGRRIQSLNDKLANRQDNIGMSAEILYRIANHIASSKDGLPSGWEAWASEIETDLRNLEDALRGEKVNEIN